MWHLVICCDLDFNTCIPLFLSSVLKNQFKIFITNFIHDIWVLDQLKCVKILWLWPFLWPWPHYISFCINLRIWKTILRYFLPNFLPRYILVITIKLSHYISNLDLFFNLDIIWYFLVLQFLQLTVAIFTCKWNNSISTNGCNAGAFLRIPESK